MTTHFFLVRHAKKEKAMGDVSITAEGVNEARLTARYFSGLRISNILTSPLKRAKLTAEYISSQSTIPVIVDERLRERANWGDLPGQTFDQFVMMWEQCTQYRDFIPPVGDSAKQAGERLLNVLTEHEEKSERNSNIVVVTHGGLITDFLVNTIPEDELRHWHPNFIAVQSALIPECSITKLEYDEDRRFQIRDFASVAHLNVK
ncbi:histidine phosphatase family protein [Neobacillus mesonae]|nr:histidine phosphatase family protein [Neobacillus mesonae]